MSFIKIDCMWNIFVNSTVSNITRKFSKIPAGMTDPHSHLSLTNSDSIFRRIHLYFALMFLYTRVSFLKQKCNEHIRKSENKI